MLWCLPSDYVDGQAETTVTQGRKLAIDTLQGVRGNRTPTTDTWEDVAADKHQESVQHDEWTML